MMETDVRVICFDDGAGDYEPRKVCGLLKLAKAKNIFP
jgi:hypothetical protein